MSIVDNNVKRRKKTKKEGEFCILVGFPVLQLSIPFQVTIFCFKNEKEKMGIVDNNVKIRKKTKKEAEFCILVGFPINETII